jgi:putative acetyltransferase
MQIKIDDLSGGEVISLLEEHLADMYATSPPESVHALDVESLKSPEITFFSGWLNGHLQGCLAIKKLTSEHVELKSMRTSTAARKSGVATKLLTHALNFAIEQGYQKVSLETGSQAFFQPARQLYKKFGFSDCEPFSNYKLDPNSCFMSIELCS